MHPIHDDYNKSRYTHFTVDKRVRIFLEAPTFSTLLGLINLAFMLSSDQFHLVIGKHLSKQIIVVQALIKLEFKLDSCFKLI